ncbi:MAG: hypothetical protein CM1200mP27_09660 [Chloroflexota bacterium]|nr:MAG: hypothetical protein CM1200mP27_09660 [Chloroflexota bacterium]
MRAEWGEDEGYTSALHHREKLIDGFRRLRYEIDAFNPDVVLVWGDDQYENFKEDIIPAFCVMAYEEFECQPMAGTEGKSATQRLERARQQNFPVQRTRVSEVSGKRSD